MGSYFLDNLFFILDNLFFLPQKNISIFFYLKKTEGQKTSNMLSGLYLFAKLEVVAKRFKPPKICDSGVESCT